MITAGQARILLLRDADYTQQQIADLLGISRETVRTCYRRVGRKKGRNDSGYGSNRSALP